MARSQSLAARVGYAFLVLGIYGGGAMVSLGGIAWVVSACLALQNGYQAWGPWITIGGMVILGITFLLGALTSSREE